MENKVQRRCQLDGEQFKELFLLRAKEVLFEHGNPGEFVIDDHNKEVLILMYNYSVMVVSDKINPLAGIILNGAYGCGKSVMISAFCRVLNDINFTSEKIIEMHAIELSELIKTNGVVPYSRVPLLIQDLGKERNSMNNFGTIIKPIADLLAIRSEYGSLTFGSTNMDKKMFSEQYHEYITKRIVEHVNLVYLPGKSRRPDYSINQL
ncbi:MAG: hypothetical protein PHU68_06010 [Paludibacter sp.]|nr:hypothetical protein [Paludibacter sp.]